MWAGGMAEQHDDQHAQVYSYPEWKSVLSNAQRKQNLTNFFIASSEQMPLWITVSFFIIMWALMHPARGIKGALENKHEQQQKKKPFTYVDLLKDCFRAVGITVKTSSVLMQPRTSQTLLRAARKTTGCINHRLRPLQLFQLSSYFMCLLKQIPPPLSINVLFLSASPSTWTLQQVAELAWKHRVNLHLSLFTHIPVLIISGKPFLLNSSSY